MINLTLKYIGRNGYGKSGYLYIFYFFEVIMMLLKLVQISTV